MADENGNQPAAGAAGTAEGDPNANGNGAGGAAGDGGIFEEGIQYDANAFNDNDKLVYKDAEGNDTPLTNAQIKEALVKQGLLKGKKDPKFTTDPTDEDKAAAAKAEAEKNKGGAGASSAETVIWDKYFRDAHKELAATYTVTTYEQFRAKLGEKFREAKAAGKDFVPNDEIMAAAAKEVDEENIKTMDRLNAPYLAAKKRLADNPAETGNPPKPPVMGKKSAVNINDINSVKAGIENYLNRGKKG